MTSTYIWVQTMKMVKIWKYGIIAKRFFYAIVALIVMLPERAIIDLGHVDGCPCAQLCIALCVKPSPYIYHIISYHIIYIYPHCQVLVLTVCNLHNPVRNIAKVANVANDTSPSLADPAELILASLKWVRNLA